MQEIKKLIQGKELVVRKRLTSFIEKLLRYVGMDFDHDRYKGIVYSELFYKTPVEEKIKNIYDSFIYLINNHINTLNYDILKRFFYLYLGYEIDESTIIKLSSKYFYLYDYAPIEKMIEFHLYVYQTLDFLNEKDRTIISIMFINFCLIASKIPAIQLYQEDYIKYTEIKNKVISKESYEELFLFFIELFQKQKFQPKNYYKELIPLTTTDIYKFFQERKNEIQSLYGVKAAYLYGSFSKGTARIDSDLDLIVIFSLDLLVEERQKKKEDFTEYLFNFFHRFVDIHEFKEFFDNTFIKETKRIKKLI